MLKNQLKMEENAVNLEIVVVNPKLKSDVKPVYYISCQAGAK
jgi:hypothetical protein